MGLDGDRLRRLLRRPRGLDQRLPVHLRKQRVLDRPRPRPRRLLTLEDRRDRRRAHRRARHGQTAGPDLVLSRSDTRVRRDPAATRVAILTGVIFVPAGLVKFAFHHWELHALHAFGLPWPSALEIFAGVLEVAGGALLVMRRIVVPVALLLAATMAVAIGASGIGHGDVIPSLTLAPALLLALLFLLSRALRPRT